MIPDLGRVDFSLLQFHYLLVSYGLRVGSNSRFAPNTPPINPLFLVLIFCEGFSPHHFEFFGMNSLLLPLFAFFPHGKV